MSRKIYLSNLEDFEKVLNNEEVISTDNLDDSIIYVDGVDNNYFILNENKVFYKKVPSLGATRQLFAMKVLEAINNKYIPIFNQDEELVFSKGDFDEIRRRMCGLKEYGAGDYVFSDNLYFDGLDYYLDRIDSNFNIVSEKRNPVVSEFIRIMSSIGLTTTMGTNSGGDIELVEAGSTMRGTNVPSEDNSKWDFDFTVRMNPENVWKVKEALESKFVAKGHITRTSAYKVRLTDVIVPGLDELIDLDFSLTPQKDEYLSTEDSLSKRLNNMKELDYEKYRLVLANIMYAKDYLKKNGVYKPSRGILEGDRSFGGLGGVGIENWILQYGGSFIDAAKDFLEHADGKDFISFQKEYFVMDFGKDHVAASKHYFPYDNFIMKNMRYKGYEKMVECLNNFVYENNNSYKR